METSPFLEPGFLLSLVAFAIGLIFWFARLEFKTTSNYERICELRNAIESHTKDFEAHQLNTSIHFNRDYARKIDDNNQLQFKKIDAELSEIKADVKLLLRKQ